MTKFLASLLVVLNLLFPCRVHGLDIALVGDSHLEGLAPFLRASLTSEGHTVHIIYHRGWSCGSYRFSASSLRAELGHPDLVVFFLGSNVRTFRRDLYAEDMQWVLDQATPARIVWFGPPYAGLSADFERHRHSSELLRELLPSSVRFFDSQEETRNLTRGRRDHLHFTPRSYRTWASLVLEHLRPQL